MFFLLEVKGHYVINSMTFITSTSSEREQPQKQDCGFFNEVIFVMQNSVSPLFVFEMVSNHVCYGIKGPALMLPHDIIFDILNGIN